MYPPKIAGFALVWYDSFTRFTTDPGHAPYKMWNVMTGKGPNSVETQYYDQSYDQSSRMTHVMSYDPSGPGQHPTPDQLFILPQKDGDQWKSARLEGKEAHACPDGKSLILQADLRLGTAGSDKQSGVWPAFWALGDSLRTSHVEWPLCGEWDIMESSDGSGWSLATAHYGKKNSNGQPEHYSLGGKMDSKHTFSQGDFHTWTLKVDRTNSNWKEQTLQWFMDGNKFQEFKGSDVDSEDSWNILAKQAYYPVLNVAIGSQFPGSKGAPDDKTGSGEETGMVVNYVAFYVSS